MAMGTKDQAYKELKGKNPRGNWVIFRKKWKNGRRLMGKITDFVSALEEDYNHMIEKIESKEKTGFRVGYYTIFHKKIKKGKEISKKDRKKSFYVNYGSQMAGRSNEKTFYKLLINAFKKDNFFNKEFKKKIFSILSKEFKK